MTEQKIKYTLGPWKAHSSPWNHGAQSDWTVFGPQSQGICQLTQYVGQPEEADACLIASAPLMLEALQAVEWGPDLENRRFCPCCQGFREHGHKSDCKLDAAIKAATKTT